MSTYISGDMFAAPVQTFVMLTNTVGTLGDVG
jgi:hypothetical protein